MSTTPRPLPMAPAGCELREQQLAEQLARYQQLSSTVLDIDRDGPRARITFAASVDTALLEHTLLVERGCCGFFTLRYDPSARTLTIQTEVEQTDGLAMILSALTPPTSPLRRDIA